MDNSVQSFGGCSKLREQYRLVGQAFLEFERQCSVLSSVFPLSPVVRGRPHPGRGFQTGVAFVAVEVLESYLEDLLDLDVSDEALSIPRQRRVLNSSMTSLLGLAGSFALGVYAASAGASLFVTFALTLSVALPFALLWHFTPSEGLARRMAFAQILSQEIARRRGADRDGRGLIAANQAMATPMRWSTPSISKSAAFGMLH